MKIQKVVNNGAKINFEAGVTKLYSDFDGTYIPQKYNHDSVCNYSPQVNRDEFKSSMDKTWQLFGDLKGSGEESKFNFTVTTGRNIAETNYFLNKLRTQDLWVPLPEKLITCNGQDEFILNVKSEEEFYKGDKQAFVKEKVNEEKRKFYQEKKWNYGAIVEKLKETFSAEKRYDMNIVFKDKKQTLPQAISEHLGVSEDEALALLKDIEMKKLSEDNVRKLLVQNNKREISEADKNDFEWYLGELSYSVYNETSRRHEVLENIPTTRSDGEYNNGLSLQSALSKKGLAREDDYIAFSDDGQLGVRVAVSDKYKNNMKKILGSDSELVRLISECEAVITPINKGSFAGSEVEIKPSVVDKFVDTKLQVDKIVKNKTNDLVIVSGDGANDAQMLTVSEYVCPSIEAFVPTSKEEADAFKDIPLVSIFVDNRSEAERADKDSVMSKMLERNKYCNYDGRLRFIHVDANDPNKPHTLDEAVKMAVASYAKVNEEFKKNLSPEMQKSLESYEYTYPHDEKLAEEFKSFLNDENYEKSIIQTHLAKINHYSQMISNDRAALGYEKIEDVILDPESDFDFQTRHMMVYHLSTMLVAFKALQDRLGKENTLQQIQQKIDTIKQSKLPKDAVERKTKFMERMFIQGKIFKAPENVKEFMDSVKVRPTPKPTPKPAPNPGPNPGPKPEPEKTVWQKFLEKVKTFAKSKNGKITIAAVGVAALAGVGALVYAKNKDD